uniref:Wsv133-like protein n=1 Tax=Metapenaeus joyneri majanivirus TaxID=2984280 RepID=A0A9C7BWC0_9VIRU|nr:MAG: wsv133-like protein [Metapenaeus joyneri majanivirus]
MASFKEYKKLLNCIKSDLLNDPVLDNPKYKKERKLLVQLAEEAAFVSFFSEIGLCMNHNLVALNSRLQKQGTTNISLQLGSHIDARFEGIKQDILTDNQYMVLLDKCNSNNNNNNNNNKNNNNDSKFNWNMSSHGTSLSDSQRRTREGLWDQMVEQKTKNEQLLVFSVIVKPHRYKNEQLIGKEERETNEEEEKKEKDDDNDDEEKKDDDEEKEYDDGKGRCSKTFVIPSKNKTEQIINWALFENCQCVARINEKLDSNEKL